MLQGIEEQRLMFILSFFYKKDLTKRGLNVFYTICLQIVFGLIFLNYVFRCSYIIVYVKNWEEAVNVSVGKKNSNWIP